MLSGLLRIGQPARDRRDQRIVNQGTFSTAADSADRDQSTDREFCTDVLKIVFADPFDPKHGMLFLDRPELGGSHLVARRQVLACERSGGVEYLFQGALGHDRSAQGPCTGPHVDDQIGGPHHRFVMLDNDDAVAFGLERTEDP